MIEKRKYPRVPAHYAVLCEKVSGAPRETLHTMAENASRIGLKINFSGRLTPGNRLKIRIIKNIDHKPISCHGAIVWVKESPLVYGEKVAGISLSKIKWTQTEALISDPDF